VRSRWTVLGPGWSPVMGCKKKGIPPGAGVTYLGPSPSPETAPPVAAAQNPARRLGSVELILTAPKVRAAKGCFGSATIPTYASAVINRPRVRRKTHFSQAKAPYGYRQAQVGSNPSPSTARVSPVAPDRTGSLGGLNVVSKSPQLRMPSSPSDVPPSKHRSNR
jgi:hypothetical protein